MSFSMHHIRRHMVTICPISSDVNFGHFCLLGFSAVNLLVFFSFVINKYLVGKHFETM